MYLRFQQLKSKKYIDSYTEILTEKLNDRDYLVDSLSQIGLEYKLNCHVNQSYNTNTSRGHTPTSISPEDVDVFYRFMEKVPLSLTQKIPYLDSYHPEDHMV